MARSNRFAERNAFVEASIEGAAALLRVEPVRAALGTYASKLADVLENDLFVPQIRSGDYRFPKDKLQTESIPVFSVLPGEHVEVIGAGLTPQQIRNASQTQIDAASGFSPEIMLQIVEAYAAGASTSRGGKMELGHDTDAGVSSRQDHIALTKGEKVLILGRPLMTMLFEKGKKEKVSPDIIVHESTHIIQRIALPIRESGKNPEARRNTASELEAYRIQSAFIQGLIEYGYKPNSAESASWNWARGVEKVRSEYADPENPYLTTRKMRRKLRVPYGNALKIK